MLHGRNTWLVQLVRLCVYTWVPKLIPTRTGKWAKWACVQAPALPEKRKTRHGKDLTLVLDLDETLVHCTVDPIVNPDHSFDVHFNGEEFQVREGGGISSYFSENVKPIYHKNNKDLSACGRPGLVPTYGILRNVC